MAEIGMERSCFIKTYCRWVDDWDGSKVLSLKEKSNKDCIFWEKGCKVYKARPLQCLIFPFWENIVASAQSWKNAALECPGMNTGELFTEKVIGEYLEMRITQPIIKKEK